MVKQNNFVVNIFKNEEARFIEAAVDINFLEFVDKKSFDNGAKLLYKHLKNKKSYRKAELQKMGLQIYWKWKKKEEYYRIKIAEEIKRRKNSENCELKSKENNSLQQNTNTPTVSLQNSKNSQEISTSSQESSRVTHEVTIVCDSDPLASSTPFNPIKRKMTTNEETQGKKQKMDIDTLALKLGSFKEVAKIDNMSIIDDFFSSTLKSTTPKADDSKICHKVTIVGEDGNDNQHVDPDWSNLEEVLGKSFQSTQDSDNDDIEYLKNFNEPTSVVVPVTPGIWDRMYSDELKTKKSLKIGWLDAFRELTCEKIKNCELTDTSNSFYSRKKHAIKLRMKCITSKTCPVKWEGYVNPLYLSIHRIGTPKHKKGENRKLRLKPHQTKMIGEVLNQTKSLEEAQKTLSENFDPIAYGAGNLRGVYTKRQVSGAKQRLKAQEAKLKKNGVQEQPELPILMPRFFSPPSTNPIEDFPSSTNSSPASTHNDLVVIECDDPNKIKIPNQASKPSIHPELDRLLQKANKVDDSGGWKEKYFSLNKRFDELIKLLSEKDEQLMRQDKELAECKHLMAETRKEAAQIVCKLEEEKMRSKETDKRRRREIRKLKKELEQRHLVLGTNNQADVVVGQKKAPPSGHSGVILHQPQDYSNQTNNDDQNLEIADSEEMSITGYNSNVDDQQNTVSPTKSPRRKANTKSAPKQSLKSPARKSKVSLKSAESSLNKKRICKSKLSMMFADEVNLIKSFVEFDFLGLIEENSLDYAAQQFLSKMLKKNVSKQHIQIFKTRWLKDEQHYKTLIENSTFQSPPKQKKNNKSKLSQLFAEQGILIDFLVQVGFVSLVDEHGLEEAIKQFFKKVYNKSPSQQNIDFFVKKWLKNEYQYRYLIKHALEAKHCSERNTQPEQPQESERSAESWKTDELENMKKQFEKMKSFMNKFENKQL